MTITNEMLDKITELAGLFLSFREIACLLGVDVDAFLLLMSNESSAPHQAYLKGKTQSKYEIRTKVITLAKMGSPQAELLAEKYIEEHEIDQSN